MKAFKRIGAIVLAGAMVVGMNTVAFAAGELSNGVVGGFTEPDSPSEQSKSINIVKDIVAYNPNGTTVNAPVITYKYTVTPASVEGLTVTDATSDHNSGVGITVPVKAGITTGLKVNDGTAGDAAQAVGTLGFTNASQWTSSSDGSEAGVNSYNIDLNFSGVTFTQPGVYRYKIDETISADSYDKVAMEDGGNNTVYLDVYVDGDLDIYGYVCMKDNGSVNPSTTTKINGFVNGSDFTGADKYYTYDLVISKDVVNDNYAETTHSFPFTITFVNAANYTSTFTISELADSPSTGISPAAASAPTWSGTANVRDGHAITYTGIPAGVDVKVYETNDLTGLTYQVTTKVNGTNAASDDAVVGNTGTSTEVTVDTEAITKIDDEQTAEIINTLLLISPTGVVLRFAPYALMLAAGLALLLVSRRRRRLAEEA